MNHPVRLLCESTNPLRNIADATTSARPFWWRGSSVSLSIALASAGAFLTSADIGTIIIEVKSANATESDSNLIRVTAGADDCDPDFTAADWAAGTGALLTTIIPYDDAALAAGSYQIIVRHEALDGSRDTYLRTTIDVHDDASESESIATPPTPPVEYYTKTESDTRYAQGRRADLTAYHTNVQSLRLLREQLDCGVSADMVVVGDSTGDGATRWPSVLAQKLAASFPSHKVVFNAVAQNAGKAWTASVVQAAPLAEERVMWQLPTSFTAWSAGTYSAGSFVSHGGKYWFSSVGSNSDTPGDETKWTEIANLKGGYLISGEDMPWLHGDGTATSTSNWEVELEYNLVNNAAEEVLWRKGPTGYTVIPNAGYMSFYHTAGGRQFKLNYAQAVGGGMNYSEACAAIPGGVAYGTRIKVRLRATPGGGAGNGSLQFHYATWNGSVWSAYSQLNAYSGHSMTAWLKCAGDFYVDIPDGSRFYGLTVKRGAADASVVDCNIPVDGWTGNGTNAVCLTGSPVLNVWNYAWSGQELEAFVGDAPLTGSTYVDYGLDFTPRNTCAFFVNCGHNAHSVSPGRQEAVRMERLAVMVAARFPRAKFIGMSQNPGVNGKLIPPYTNLDYSRVEYFKRLKASHIQASAQRLAYGYLDINRVFREDPRDPLSLSQEGLHPNVNGSLLWANELFDLIHS